MAINRGGERTLLNTTIRVGRNAGFAVAVRCGKLRERRMMAPGRENLDLRWGSMPQRSVDGYGVRYLQQFAELTSHHG
jgi:hypothetical protein